MHVWTVITRGRSLSRNPVRSVLHGYWRLPRGGSAAGAQCSNRIAD